MANHLYAQYRLITKKLHNYKDRAVALEGRCSTSEVVQLCTNEANRWTPRISEYTTSLVDKATGQPSSGLDGGSGWTKVYSKRQKRMCKLRKYALRIKCPFIKIGESLYPRDECDSRCIIIYHNFQSAKQLHDLLSRKLSIDDRKLVCKVRLVRRYSKSNGLIYGQVICEPNTRDRILSCLEASKTFAKYKLRLGRTHSERASLIKAQNRLSKVRVVKRVVDIEKNLKPNNITVQNRFSNLESSTELSVGESERHVINAALRIISLNCNGLSTSMVRMVEFCNQQKPHIIALQESYVHEDFVPHLIGYSFFGNMLSGRERRGQDGMQKHGTGFFVRKSLLSQTKPVYNSSKSDNHFWIEVKKQDFSSSNGKQSISIGSIYWNAGWNKEEWHSNLKKLDKICVKLKERSDLILMGDFNYDLRFLLKSDESFSPQSKKGLLQEFMKTHNLTLTKFCCDPIEYHTRKGFKGGRLFQTAIDFILVQKEVDLKFAPVKALHYWDFDSDHAGLTVIIKEWFKKGGSNSTLLNGLNNEVKSIPVYDRWDTKILRKKKFDVPTGDQPDVSMDDTTEVSPQEAWMETLGVALGNRDETSALSALEDYQEWEKCLKRAADEFFGKREGSDTRSKSSWPKWYSKDVRKILRKRDRIWVNLNSLYDKYIKFSSAPNSLDKKSKCHQDIEKLTKKYEACRETSRMIVKQSKAETFDRSMERVNELYYTDPKEFWRVINGLTANDSSYHASSARQGKSSSSIKDPKTGLLISGGKEFLTCWATYFESLGKRTYKLSENDIEEMELTLTSPSDSELITEDDLREAAEGLLMWKAPGVDGFTNEMIKKIKDCPEVLTSFTQMFNRIQKDNVVPVQWSESIICPIPKDGDLTDLGNYRGISLISSVAKLYTRALNIKMQTFLEDSKSLLREQAGFRTDRRCLDHIFTLQDVVHRRMQVEKPTYVVFIDFRKAYDLVPREKLFKKMRTMGITEGIISNVKAYYKVTTARVRVSGSFSDPFGIDIGVKQGCTMSPLLFSIFINDILDEVKQLNLGVSIPGVMEKLSGLIYADDLALLIERKEDIQPTLDCISRWCRSNHMSTNASKCAILAFGKKWEEYTEELKLVDYLLEGKVLPINTCYKYLGVTFCSDLSWEKEVKNRSEKGLKCLRMITPILRNDRIRIKIRLNYLKAVWIPVVLYGSEVWYQSRNQMKVLDGLYLECIRMVMGCSRISPNYVLLAETDMKPLFALVVKNRAQTYSKWFNMNTSLTSSFWLNTLIRLKSVGRCWSWLRYCRTSLGKLGINHSRLETPMCDTRKKNKNSTKLAVGAIFDIELFIKGEQGPRISENMHKVYIRECVEKSLFQLYLEKLAKKPSCESYMNYMRERGSLKSETYLSEVKYSLGCKILFRARSGSLLIGERIGSHGLSGTDKCVFCPRKCKETLFHIAFECEGYKTYFEEFFNLIQKYTTKVYRNRIKEPVERSRVNWLIGSQPDFKLAYLAPLDRDSEEYDNWQSKLRKLYSSFISSRVRSFEQMWRWRMLVLSIKLGQGSSLTQIVSPGGQAQRVCRNQIAGGDVVHTDNSMEDIM